MMDGKTVVSFPLIEVDQDGKKHLIYECSCGKDVCMPYSLEEACGATTDCPYCGALLIFSQITTGIKACNVGIYPFHAYLNANDTRWPADGAGTYSVEF